MQLKSKVHLSVTAGLFYGSPGLGKIIKFGLSEKHTKFEKNLPHGFDKSADLHSKRQNHEEDFFIMCASQKIRTLQFSLYLDHVIFTRCLMTILVLNFEYLLYSSFEIWVINSKDII